MSERAGYQCQIKISGSALSLTDEVCNTSDNVVYQITNTAKQVLDRTANITVKDDGTETAEEYTLNRLNGTVTFGSSEARVITITGYYLPMTVAAYANSSSESRVTDLLDVTVFGDTHKKRKAGLKSASGTLSQFNITDTTYIDALTAGDPIVIEQRTLSTDEPNRFWALLESSEVSAAVEGLQNETISWVSYDSWIRLGE